MLDINDKLLNLGDLDDLSPFKIERDAAKWELLIDQIIEGNVIPVIGSDILMEDCNPEQLLINHIARTIGINGNPASFSELLYSPECASFKENVYVYLNMVCSQCRFPPSSLLKRILSIRQFPFIITTSFFPVIENVMGEIWGERKVKSLVFDNNPSTTSLKGVGDIARVGDISTPTVYYMFGKVCDSAHRYVVTDVDMLSFCRSWLSSERRPPVLSSILKNKYLLVLGNSYPDWLFRFIWYSMNSTDDEKDPFSKTPGMMVSNKAEDTLIQFLNRLNTFTQKDPEYVVATIEQKLKDKKDYIERQHFNKPQKDCDVFISYYREDHMLAGRLYEMLTAKGLNVWYDLKKINYGDQWMREIEEAIDTVRLFVPIVSQKTLSEEDKEFHMYRKEWTIADRRADGFSRQFIMPLVSDDVNIYSARLPQSFKHAHAGVYDANDLSSLNTFVEGVLSTINTL